jgi:NOL1/NOP2/fmu family ribosome biogenesis protein
MSDGPENRSDAFERLPATEAERAVDGRVTRREVVDYWTDRFGVPAEIFADVTFWEKGAGRIWALSYDLDGPVAIEALGLPILRTRQEFWKPTTDAARRFGTGATRNVIHLDEDPARVFLAGEDQELPWDGDWGYLIVTHDVAGEPEPIGVGRYTYGSLQSMLPKGQRRRFD